MLVLSRKKDEQIRVGDDVIITVTKISGNRVQIGIDAPKNMPIVRGGLPIHERQEADVQETVVVVDESEECEVAK